MNRMSRQVMSGLTAMMCLAVCASIANADVKIKTKNTQGNTSTEQIVYIKGQRQRTEIGNGMMVSVMQCDQQRSLQINPQTKTYLVNPFNQPANSADSAASPSPSRKDSASRGGIITTTITTKDTGERKQMFGYPARHFLMTMSTQSSPEACQQTRSKMEIDAWYIDAAFALDCMTDPRYQGYNPAGQSGCQDRNVVKQVGPAIKGYPVWSKTTMFDDRGAPTFTIEQETVELSQATLDAALFDVPAGYREVKNYAEMYTGAASTEPSNEQPEDAPRQTDATAAKPSTNATDAKASPDTPKKKTAKGILKGIIKP